MTIYCVFLFISKIFKMFATTVDEFVEQFVLYQSDSFLGLLWMKEMTFFLYQNTVL